MNTITASQKNRRERIADALRIEWNGHKGSYSVDGWVHARQMVENALSAGVFVDLPIWFEGKCHRVTLSSAQDLVGFYHESFNAQQEAKLK